MSLRRMCGGTASAAHMSYLVDTHYHSNSCERVKRWERGMRTLKIENNFLAFIRKGDCFYVLC